METKLTDREALERIYELMTGSDWDGDLFCSIADVLVKAGYEDVNEREYWIKSQ